MRDYQKIIQDYDSQHVIKHEWGQNATALFNRVVKLWNKINVGEKIAISSYKKLGIKSAVKFLEKNGLNAKIVGKGPENLRLVEIEKDSNKLLEVIDTKEIINFDFNSREYQVNVGDAIFSKTDLDAGTRFLLEIFLETKIDLNNRNVADLGSGWGAISLVLVNEFPLIQITAYEKEDSSIEVSQINLENYQNVTIVKTDLTQKDSKDIEKNKEKFDYIVSNPPFHATKDERTLIFENAKKLLKTGGEMFFVTEGHFVGRFRKTAMSFFSILEEKNKDLWVVFRCKKN